MKNPGQASTFTSDSGTQICFYHRDIGPNLTVFTPLIKTNSQKWLSLTLKPKRSVCVEEQPDCRSDRCN